MEKIFLEFSFFSVFWLKFADFKPFRPSKACIRSTSAICIFHSHLQECQPSIFHGLQQGTTLQNNKICEKRPFLTVLGSLDPLKKFSSKNRYPSAIPMINAHLLVYWLTSFYGDHRRTRIYKVATSVFLSFLCIFRAKKVKRIFFFKFKTSKLIRFTLPINIQDSNKYIKMEKNDFEGYQPQ